MTNRKPDSLFEFYPTPTATAKPSHFEKASHAHYAFRMVPLLDATSQRVLGSLMEKEMTTPELYPLSVNSLLAACNQKTSREPVMQLTEDEVREALDRLEGHELVSVSRDGRVARFEHRIRTVLQLRRDETALLCLLLLRGAQTAGELRARSDRMFTFADPAQIQSTLDRLASRTEPLTLSLARAPGLREGRWTHLLGDTPFNRPVQDLSSALELPGPSPDLLARLEALERRVEQLEAAQDPKAPQPT